MQSEWSNSFILIIGLLLIALFWIILFNTLPIGLFLVIIGAIFTKMANFSSSKSEQVIGTLGSWLYPLGIILSFVNEGFWFGILSIVLALWIYGLSKKDMYGDWQWLVDVMMQIYSSNDLRKSELLSYLNLLFLKDNIDPKLYQANLFIATEKGYELAKSKTILEPEDSNLHKLLKICTPSVRKLDFIGGVPMGFSTLFSAAYPDVILWNNKLSDKKLAEIFKNLDEKTAMNDESQFTPETLRLLIDSYLETGKKLECSRK